MGGKRLIDHAADAIRPHVDAVVVCGRELEGWTSLADLPRPGLGPLGGIAAALAYAEAQGFASVLTIGCDMPDVPEALVERLVATLPSYCADAPILGHWFVNEADTLIRHAGLVPASKVEQSRSYGNSRYVEPRNKALLSEVEGSGVTVGAKSPHLSVRRWAESIGATAIPSPRPLANINTPSDLATS
jgi:molybdopterin-guanine dinucleotide biosynthesis protein A